MFIMLCTNVTYITPTISRIGNFLKRPTENHSIYIMLIKIIEIVSNIDLNLIVVNSLNVKIRPKVYSRLV